MNVVENRGIEPLTSALRTRRAPSCANSPCLRVDYSTVGDVVQYAPFSFFQFFTNPNNLDYKRNQINNSYQNQSYYDHITPYLKLSVHFCFFPWGRLFHGQHKGVDIFGFIIPINAAADKINYQPQDAPDNPRPKCLRVQLGHHDDIDDGRNRRTDQDARRFVRTIELRVFLTKPKGCCNSDNIIKQVRE